MLPINIGRQVSQRQLGLKNKIAEVLFLGVHNKTKAVSRLTAFLLLVKVYLSNQCKICVIFRHIIFC